jgi:hypothetical protein
MSVAVAYVPGFESDVFISYSHVDNLPSTTARRWVDEFQTALENRLAKRVGRIGLVRVWRDPAVDGSQVFGEVIAQRVARSAVFLALNSRGYLASDYCRQELTSFFEQAARSPEGLQIAERRRAIHVLLTNVPRSEWLSELKGTTGFHLHDGSEEEGSLENGRIAEPLNPRSKEFNDRIRGLADALYHLLTDFKTRREKVTNLSFPVPQRYVYVADTADTLQDVRLRLTADLRQAGAEVVEDVPPPYTAAEHEAAVRRVVGGAVLSVHLLDQRPGRPVDGDRVMTYPRKQVDIALETRTPLLIWMRPEHEMGLPPASEHLKWLEALERGPRGTMSYEFLRSSPASLSSIVLEKLLSIEGRVDSQPFEDAETVLIDTHVKDQRSAFELGKYLVDRGVQPFIHQETDNPADSFKAFEDQLSRVKTLVVMFGLVSRAWMEQRVKCALQFAAKQLANDTEQTLQSCYVYILPPRKEMRVLTRGIFRVDVLDGSRSDRFEPSAIAPLLQTLRSGEAR